MAWGLGINSLYEYLTKQWRQKSFTKPFLFAVFILQAVLFALLVTLFKTGKATASLVVITFLIVIMESQTALSVILAGDLFGSQNRVMAYGLSFGLAVGPGEASFTYIMSAVERKSSEIGVVLPASFSPFYWLCATALLFGSTAVGSLSQRMMSF